MNYKDKFKIKIMFKLYSGEDQILNKEWMIQKLYFLNCTPIPSWY